MTLSFVAQLLVAFIVLIASLGLSGALLAERDRPRRLKA